MEIEERLAAALSDRYTVERELGEGGMAVVYLADDLKHDRRVALKVLKPELAAVVGADRFVSEIRTTANLQHPHILPLFDSGESDGFLFYVMPYVEGETLRERLDREKQLPVEEAVSIARKVAGALQAAHDQGVIHRDIKPANILLQKGEPVVSDFGIALAVSQAGGGRLTETGLSLGTPYYMAPEQATADRDPDQRSDLYSLACVLYEMLAGEPPFTGGTAQAVLGRILTSDPTPIRELRRSVSPDLEAVVLRALEKTPADRFQSAQSFADALGRADLAWSGGHTVPGGTGSSRGARLSGAGAGSRSTVLPWALLVLTLAVAAVALLTRSNPEATQAWHLDLDILEELTPTGEMGPTPTISPDGRRVALTAERAGRSGIWVRSLDEADFRLVPGTEDGSGPEFSPDGEWIAFTRNDALYKVTLSGGGLTRLLDVDTIQVVLSHWGTDDRIAVSGPDGIYLVSANSGAIEDVVRVATLGSYDPFLLPDGNAVLSSGQADAEGLRVHVADRDTTILLMPTGRYPKFVEPGHLLYIDAEGTLFAVDFDPATYRVSGTPVRLIDRIGGGVDFYTVSRAGHLIYGDGPPTDPTAGNEAVAIAALDGGEPERVPLPRAEYEDVRAAPDGRRIVLIHEAEENQSDVFVFDLLTQEFTRLTDTGTADAPLWSPDGEWIVYADYATDRLHVVRADGTGEPVALGDETLRLTPSDWVEGDRILAWTSTRDQSDVWMVQLAREDDGWSVESVGAYLSGPFGERDAVVSPDETRAAFVSLRTGAVEVWVASFPVPTEQHLVTERGGGWGRPRWAPDGTTLLVPTSNAGVDSLFAADLDPDDITRLRYVRDFEDLYSSEWDVLPDGERVVYLFNEERLEIGEEYREAGREDDLRVRFHVVVNWRTEFERILREAGR